MLKLKKKIIKKKLFNKKKTQYLLQDDFLSPSINAEIAVKIKLSEFATGTAIDSSVSCSVKKYSTLPH